MILIVVFIATIGILSSFSLLMKNQPEQGRKISVRNFIVLILVYLTVMTGFASVYLTLELHGFPVLKEGGHRVYGSFIHLIEDVMYFSAVTLLTVGYGDITPQGIGRWIAMIQSLIGYLLPAAFVVSTVIFVDERSK